MSHYPINTTVYFSIGEAVASIGILLAFISLATPIRRFRWSLGQFKLHTAYALFVVGIIFVIISALLPVFPNWLRTFTGYPIFWESLAGIVFIFGSFGLIICGMCPIRFTKKNYKGFFQLCYDVIARGDDQELGALAKEISYSAESIVTTCLEYNRIKAYFAEKEGKSYSISEYVQWALMTMDLWSDRKLCNAIITRCPGTAVTFLREIQKQRMYDSGGYSFVEQMIAEAFRDTNSILHREEQYSGLGHFLPFTETVFGNYDFISSHFRPLQAAGYIHITLKNLEKYIECLKRALTAYLDAGKYYGDLAAISCGVDVLTKSARKFVGRIGSDFRSENLDDDPTYALMRISGTFNELLKLVISQEDKLPDYTLDPNNYNHFKDNSIYGVLARGIYEYFDRLTRMKGHDEDMRLIAIDIWMEIYSPSAIKESKAIIEIQRRLEIHLWKQVQRNLEEKHFCYPMITRLLLNLNGLSEHSEASDGLKRVSKQLLSLLKEKYRHATQLTEKRGQEMLPDGYEYDKEENTLIERNRWGGKPIVFQCD